MHYLVIVNEEFIHFKYRFNFFFNKAEISLQSTTIKSIFPNLGEQYDIMYALTTTYSESIALESNSSLSCIDSLQFIYMLVIA